MTANPTELRVAAGPLGHAGAVWRDAGGSMGTAVSFNTPGGAFGAPQLLSGAGATGEPAIPIGVNGAAIVAWEEDPGGSSDAIAARVRSSGSTSLGAVDYLQGPEDGASSNIGNPAVDVFSGSVPGQVGVAAFTHHWYCYTLCYWHVGMSNIAGPGSFSTTESVIGNGGWQNLDVETQNGSAIIVAKSDVCCNQRTISPAGRASGGAWVGGDALAYGDGNNTGCLCGSVPRIARLPDGSAAIVYTRKASPGDNIQFGEFSLARAMGHASPALPVLSETTLNSASETGGSPRVVSDAAGDLVVGWLGNDGRVLTRYRPAGGSFQAVQVVGTEASSPLDRNFSLAMGAGGRAYVAYLAGGAVQVAMRPAGAGSSWGAPEAVSGSTTEPDGLDLAAGANRAFAAFVARGEDSAKRVYAATYVPQHTLTVAKGGTGSGTVDSSPAGIACGTTCSGAFDEGTVVTLNATPAAGSTFDGWSGGGCAGTAGCVVLLAADTAVSASFSQIPSATTTTTPTTTGDEGTGSGKKKKRRPTYGRCVKRANRAFHKLLKQARHKHGRARAKAVKAAKKRRGRLIRRCRARFHKKRHAKRHHRRHRG